MIFKKFVEDLEKYIRWNVEYLEEKYKEATEEFLSHYQKFREICRKINEEDLDEETLFEYQIDKKLHEIAIDVDDMSAPFYEELLKGYTQALELLRRGIREENYVLFDDKNFRDLFVFLFNEILKYIPLEKIKRDLSVDEIIQECKNAKCLWEKSNEYGGVVNYEIQRLDKLIKIMEKNKNTLESLIKELF